MGNKPTLKKTADSLDSGQYKAVGFAWCQKVTAILSVNGETEQ